MKGEQLALEVQLPQSPTLGAFFPGPNAEAVAGVRALIDGQGATQVFLWGGAGTGKTHLLCAAGASATGGVRVSLRGGACDWPLLHEAALVALDDLDALARRPEDELPLLRLLDARRAAGRPLIVAASAPPARLSLEVPDLRTRLSAMLPLALKPMRDEDRQALLRVRARQRGLELPHDVVRWLLGHYTRDAGSLVAVLEELDRASLSAQRRLTLPFVQGVLRGAKD